MAIDCYECTAYGDDYYLNDYGEWVSACEGCPNNDEETKIFLAMVEAAKEGDA